jgi:hypothetical protein
MLRYPGLWQADGLLKVIHVQFARSQLLDNTDSVGVTQDAEKLGKFLSDGGTPRHR